VPKPSEAPISLFQVSFPIKWLLLLSVGVIVSIVSNNIAYAVIDQESYTLVKEWGSRGSGDGQFHLPWSLTLEIQIMCM
jgi:hypothetical protein